MPSQLAGRKGGDWPSGAPGAGGFAPPLKMIMPRYGKRPWEPEEDNQLREMVEAGKAITIISLRLKRTVTAVRDRLGILRVSLGKVGRRPKENPPA
jgi:hypothetical protein